MKLLLRDYIASLKERNELDAILPDLLGELGFNVFSRPGIGTTQRGVDVAAVHTDERGRQRVYLFCVKPGDLNRQEWDGTPQKMRSSLNEIRDDYIPNYLPAAYKRLSVVIVICLGGQVKEDVRSLLSTYTRQHTTRRISYEEWNGDRLADMLLMGVLREKVLPKPLQSYFQKAVAMVDQPDTAYEQFARLVHALRGDVRAHKDRVRVARQIYICLWVLYVWARDVDNLDAPYRASELALLTAWQLVKPYIGKKDTNAKAVVSVVNYLAQLHIIISSSYLDTKIIPHVKQENALSIAVRSAESVDINIKMFDLLGRIAMAGHWLYWSASYGGREIPREISETLDNLARSGIDLIYSNESLFLPVMDQHAIEIALFLTFAVPRKVVNPQIAQWLGVMTRRLQFTVVNHDKYPCVLTEYRDLLDHPKEKTDDYRREATSGSILIPLLAAWLTGFRDDDALRILMGLAAGDLQHCTLQLWLPDIATEDHLYLNDAMHGVALTDLPMTADGQALLKTIRNACDTNDAFLNLSAMRTAYFPLVLTACRHYRLPIPPQFWIYFLVPPAAVAGI